MFGFGSFSSPATFGAVPLNGPAPINGVLAITESADLLAFSGTVAWPQIEAAMAVSEPAGQDVVSFIGGTKYVEEIITTDGSAPAASLSGLVWAVFDALTQAPVASGSNGSTDAAGKFRAYVIGTSKAVGSDVWLALTNSDGTSAQTPAAKAFLGPVQVKNA